MKQASVYEFSRHRHGKSSWRYRLIVFANEGGSELERKAGKGWRSVDASDRDAWGVAASVKRAGDAVKVIL